MTNPTGTQTSSKQNPDGRWGFHFGRDGAYLAEARYFYGTKAEAKREAKRDARREGFDTVVSAELEAE
jgi:hypothetical protein